MAMISGSNGGISKNFSKFDKMSLFSSDAKKYAPIISYFINNECQLNCRHCYVGYKHGNDALSVQEWERVFHEFIYMGSLIFGLAGKEPLIHWPKTKRILNYLKLKKNDNNRIKFGLVSNGLLLGEGIIDDLLMIQPDYFDISLDGDEIAHEKIRGKGTYKKLIEKIKLIPANSKLIENTFIAFTLNSINVDSLKSIICTSYDLNIKNFVISPYLTKSKMRDELYFESKAFAAQMRQLVDINLIDFSKFVGLNIFIKTDCFEENPVVDQLICKNIINLDKLFIDEYGTLFNEYSYGSNSLYFNYPVINDIFTQTLRISHDGYVSNCFDMFYENFTERAIGNIRKDGLSKISENIKYYNRVLN